MIFTEIIMQKFQRMPAQVINRVVLDWGGSSIKPDTLDDKQTLTGGRWLVEDHLAVVSMSPSRSLWSSAEPYRELPDRGAARQAQAIHSSASAFLISWNWEIAALIPLGCRESHRYDSHGFPQAEVAGGKARKAWGVWRGEWVIRKCTAFMMISMNSHLIFKYQMSFCLPFIFGFVSVSFLLPGNIGLLRSYGCCDERRCAQAAWSGDREMCSWGCGVIGAFRSSSPAGS